MDVQQLLGVRTCRATQFCTNQELRLHRLPFSKQAALSINLLVNSPNIGTFYQKLFQSLAINL